MPAQHLPILAALLVALVLGAVLLLLARLASRRKSTGGATKLSPYESGMPLLDPNRKRISIIFFLVAIDFVVFDVEAAFLYPWVLVLREGGWPLFWAVMLFVALILVGFVYIWRQGGLDLSPRREIAGDAPAAEGRG